MRTARWLTAILGVSFILFSGSVVFCNGAGQAQGGPEVAAAVRKGVDFLLRTQHADGSWGESTVGRDYEVLADVPGSHRAFRVATSALCVMALRNSGIREEAVDNAIRKGLKYLIAHARVKRPNPLELYNVWAFGYCLRCFSETLFAGSHPDMEVSMKEAAKELVDALKLYQVPDGGWGYLDLDAKTYRPGGHSTSFTTGTIVISLYTAEKVGIEVPAQMLQKALKNLHRCRKEDGSYLYGLYMLYMRFNPNHPVNKLKGSVCRTSCCHLAQYLFDEKVTKEDLAKGVEALIEQNRFVDTARKKPVPHEGWYANSGYFYLYGHFYASMALQQLSKDDQQRLWPSIKGLILRLQEPDGSWWDYPLYGYHKYYGTAYAVLTLCWDRYGKELDIYSQPRAVLVNSEGLIERWATGAQFDTEILHKLVTNGQRSNRGRRPQRQVTNSPTERSRPSIPAKDQREPDLGKVHIDARERSLRFPVSINQRTGLVEYAVVTEQGKTHESVFRTEAEPTHIHLGLLLLGATPAYVRELPIDPSQKLPGESVHIEITWTEGGVERSKPLGDFVVTTNNAVTLAPGPWVYNGSVLTDYGLAAQGGGSIVSLWLDPGALINNPRPGREDDELHHANPRAFPTEPTGLEMVIRVAQDKKLPANREASENPKLVSK